MQKFTKIEISWIVGELDKLAKTLEQRSKEEADRSFVKAHRLRAERYADISQRLRLALKEGNKRIEIK